MNWSLLTKKHESETETPGPGFSLNQGALGKTSRIGAPLAPKEDFSPLRDEAPEPDLDAPIPPTGRQPLSLASQAVESLLPVGYCLRAMGSAPTDRAAIYHHWIALDPESLYFRFFSPVNHYVLRKRAAEANFTNPRFAGIFDSLGHLACLAEWALDSELPGKKEAEAAFSTAPNHRRRGLAKVAAAACAIDAREAGVTRLRIDTLRDNWAAQSLARSLGGARSAAPGSQASEVVSSFIELTAPDALGIESCLGFSAPERPGTRRF